MASSCVLFHFTLLIVTVIDTGNGCPELCTCSDKYQRHFAECSYRDLADIPSGLPANVTTISLSANRISYITFGSFDNVTLATSLWMAHNNIVSIDEGSLVPLIHLRNFDISHNKIVDFPWGDLQNLTALQLLKMNHNEMELLPRDAFTNLKHLRSLRLNNNKFVTIAEGTFDGLISLSHLQLYHNPYACTCFMDWLRDWIGTTTISVPEQHSIVCASPQQLKGATIIQLPQSKCTSPNVTITAEPNIENTNVDEDTLLILTCEYKGNPRPAVLWEILTKNHKEKIVLPSEDDNSAELTEDSLLADKPFKVFNNGSLIISHVDRKDSGNYSCSATNEFDTAQATVSIEVVTLPKATATKSMPNPTLTPVFPSSSLPDPERKAILNVTPSLQPPPVVNTESRERPQRNLKNASKCGLTPHTRYVSNRGFNASLEDVKQYTFESGVVALAVSETEARMRLDPLLVSKDKIGNRLGTSGGLSAVSDEPRGVVDASGEVLFPEGLYLCLSADFKHAAVQWSRIQEGINAYVFTDLHPGTNYSLCLTYSGQYCDVQVLFTTRRRVPNLLIIISVSICLLTVSTVPLLGATCFHLVYKYRGKTYKLILKAKDQCQVERNLVGHLYLHVPHQSESQRNINGSMLDEEEAEGAKESREEGSPATECFTMSRGDTEDCEAGSEYSDRLPLGAEAINITSSYKYPDQI